MTLQKKSKNISIIASLRFFLIPTIMLLLTFETLAVTGCDNSTMRNNNPAAENRNVDLPSSVVEAVLNDVSEKAQISRSKLTITEAQRELWTNGCLDLAQAGEFCTQAMVPGWRVFVSGDDQTWIYHTDQQGKTLRVEP